MNIKLLKILAGWRKKLAENILFQNPNISSHTLNIAVEKIAICIIFLRILEDKEYDAFSILKKLMNKKTNICHHLLSIFKKAHTKYQSLLFENSTSLDFLKLDDDVLKDLISTLYCSECTTHFFTLTTEDLSNIYEELISHTFKIKNSPNDEKKTIIKEKNKTQKEKGIYYTPPYIAQYIINHTVAPLLEGKSITEISNIRIIDASCGGGIFLILAYRFLLEWHLRYYINKDNLQSSLENGKIEEKGKGIYQLSIKERTKILANNIFGLDIDEKAVEITKLALYLELLKDYTRKTKGGTSYFQHNYIAIFKVLKNNIKVGNALVSSDFYSNKEILTNLKDGNDLKIKPFDWEEEFKNIFENGGFDVVIGNPPYVSAENQVAIEKLKVMRDYIKTCKRYKFLHQRWDIYIPFIEKGLSILKDGGLWSYIIPHAFTSQLYAKKLREHIQKNYNLIEIVSLKDAKIFSSVIVPTCIPIIKKEKGRGCCQISYIDTQKNIKTAYTKSYSELVIDDISSVWNLEKDDMKCSLYKNMYELGDFCYVSYGLRANSNEKTAKGAFKKKDLISEVKDDEHPRKYIEAKDISRYAIDNVRYLEYGTKRSPSQLVRPTFPEWYEVPKIFVKLLGSLVGTMDVNNNFLHDCSIVGATLWRNLKNIENKSISSSISRYSKLKRCEMEELSKKLNLYYLLAIINSTYAKRLIARKKAGSLSTYPEYIRHFPIPIPEPKDIKALSSFAKEELALHQNLKKTCKKKEVDIIKEKLTI